MSAGPPSRRLVLITGASAGIGAALARLYARAGWDLALAARREDRLRTLADEVRGAHGADCIVMGADLLDPAAPDRIVRHIAQSGRTIDGLVNNAGYGGPAGALAGDWRRHADFIQVMVTAPVHLARLTAPGMAARGFGRILNVASLAGMTPPARGQALYGAAKAFLIEASRALHLEMRGTGVHVTALCPGLTRTEFHAAAGMDMLARTTPDFLWQSAEAVAEAGYRACEANAAVRVPGAINKTAAALFRLLPDPAGMALMARASRHWDSRAHDGRREE